MKAKEDIEMEIRRLEVAIEKVQKQMADDDNEFSFEIHKRTRDNLIERVNTLYWVVLS